MKLADARKGASLTQSALGQILGVPTSRVSNIEARYQRPTRELAIEISSLLKVDASQIEEFISIFSEYPNLRGNEQVGDPCTCGCGGGKILPESRIARKLVISLPCSSCGHPRTFAQSARHTKNCLFCAGRHRPQKKYEGNTIGSRANSALLLALDRKGMTKTQAMMVANLSPASLSNWFSGQNVPSIESIQALAGVLDAPELISLIPHSDPVIVTMTCDSCGRSNPRPAGAIRAAIKDGRLLGSVINYSKGTGSYRKCAPCARSANGKALIRRRTRGRGGKAIMVEWGRKLSSEQTHEERSFNIKKAQAARRGTKSAAEHILRVSAARCVARPVGTFNLCQRCGLVTFIERNNYPGPGQAHGCCLHQFLRENKRATPYPYNPAQNKKGKAHLTSEYLSKSYELCVRLLLHHEAVGDKEHLDDDGELVEAHGLAGEFGVTPRAVYARVNAFLDLLPQDNRGGEPLMKKVRMLRWADGHRNRYHPTFPESVEHLSKMGHAEAFLKSAVQSEVDLIPSARTINAAIENGISETTLRRAFANGRYKAVQVGRAWHWRRKRSRET